jgi:hypothetical protein
VPEKYGKPIANYDPLYVDDVVVLYRDPIKKGTAQ